MTLKKKLLELELVFYLIKIMLARFFFLIKQNSNTNLKFNKNYIQI